MVARKEAILEQQLLPHNRFVLPPADTFQRPYRFGNSPKAVQRFPFPFATDAYSLGVNAEPHDRTGETAALDALFDIDEHYLAELANREAILSADPSRLQLLPHMHQAGWDTLELIMSSLAADFPDWFQFQCRSTSCLWSNRLLDTQWDFVLGDDESLGCSAFEFIGRQVQGDLILLDQRENNLWLDAGLLTEAIGWSLDFALGMNWTEWHGPIVTARERSVVDRGLHMALALPAGQPVRRVTWSLQMTPRLDRAIETLPDWVKEEDTLSWDSIGEHLFLRTEFQQLYRLGRSNALLFAIRHYQLSMNQLLAVPKWTRRLHRVLRDLDPTSERFRLMPNRQLVVDWLARFDDGAPTSPGRGPQ